MNFERKFEFSQNQKKIIYEDHYVKMNQNIGVTTK
jgi:hypothetical protein